MSGDHLVVCVTTECPSGVVGLDILTDDCVSVYA